VGGAARRDQDAREFAALSREIDIAKKTNDGQSEQVRELTALAAEIKKAIDAKEEVLSEREAAAQAGGRGDREGQGRRRREDEGARHAPRRGGEDRRPRAAREVREHQAAPRRHPPSRRWSG